ncbi:DMT family transporter [Paenibacillus planticolens]|nr:DMT family transporter [Paenibacillus planticolens]
MKGILVVFFSLIFTSLSPIVNKFLVNSFSYVDVAIFTSILQVLFSFVLILIQKVEISWKKFFSSIDTSFLYTIAILSMFISANNLSPIYVGFIGRFYVVFSTILSVVILKEKIQKVEIVFIVFAILGTFLFVSKESSDKLIFIGVIFSFLYTFCFSLTNILIKFKEGKTHYLASMLYNNLVATIVILSYRMFFVKIQFATSQITFSTSILFILSALCGFLGTFLLFYALKFISFTFSSIIRSFSPVLVALFSWPFFGMDLSPLNIIGCILLFSSVVALTVYQSSYKQRRERTKPSSIKVDETII